MRRQCNLGWTARTGASLRTVRWVRWACVCALVHGGLVARHHTRSVPPGSPVESEQLSGSLRPIQQHPKLAVDCFHTAPAGSRVFERPIQQAMNNCHFPTGRHRNRHCCLAQVPSESRPHRSIHAMLSSSGEPSVHHARQTAGHGAAPGSRSKPVRSNQPDHRVCLPGTPAAQRPNHSTKEHSAPDSGKNTEPLSKCGAQA